MKRIEPNMRVQGGGLMHLAPLDSTMLASLPNLLRHCVVTRYEDGSARTPGYWTTGTQGPSWVITVKDPDSRCQMRVVAPSVDDALAMADILLGSEDAPWEVDRWATERAQQNSKKR